MILRAMCVICTVAFVSACSSPQVSLQTTQLMPEEVALRIVAKYTSASWAARPIMLKGATKKDWLGGCDEPRATPVRYSEIVKVVYVPVENIVWLWTDGPAAVTDCPPNVMKVAVVKISSSADAQEFANALSALGARLK